MQKVNFRKQRGFGWTVEVAGEQVGTLMVERMGWKQFDAKRGTPSQTWRFISAWDSTKNASADYFKDIKAKVIQIFS